MASVKRTFNYTGRKRIYLDNLRVVLRPKSDHYCDIELELTLRDLGLKDADDAKVFLEAQWRNEFCRREIGEVRDFSASPRQLPLTGLGPFSDPKLIQFRIKVVKSALGGEALLLAQADHIRPHLEEGFNGRESILHTKFTELGDLAWSTDFDGGDAVLFLVNHRLPSSYVTADATFCALVYPALVREVLTAALNQESAVPNPQSSEWFDRWLAWAKGLVDEDPPGYDADSDDKRVWIEEVVKAFAEKHVQCRRFLEAAGHSPL